MEASMASEMSVKSDQNEPLQLHSMPPWKRYESEEEDVSETSSQSVFSPTEGEISNESDADESVSEAGSIDTEMLAPVYHKVSSDDSSSLYSHRLSIITAKRSSTATCVPNDYGRDASTADDNGDVSPCTEYMTPPLSPIYLSALCYVPDGSESSSREEESANAEDNDEDEAHEAEWHEVSEAKQVFFTAPASRPNIVMIQSLTTEAILTARMGNPIQLQQFTEQNSLSLNTRPLNLRKRPSTKRSSSALELTTTPDRSKRFSAMFFHDFTQNGETAYFDSRNPTRAYASPGSRTGSSRMDSSVSNTTNSSEPRQSRLRRNPSLRSSSRSSRYAPEYQSPPNYSRPRSIRSSSVASDMTSGSSASWRRVQTYNWSSTSLQYPSSSSSVADRPSSSSSSPSPGENEPSRPTPHPLSIITTSTSPTTASPPQPQSAITSHSSSSDIDWSPVVEYRQSSTTPNQKPVPYSRLHNPSLSVSLATATEVLDPSRSRARSGSMTPSPVATTPTTRKSSISAVMPAAAAAATSSKSSANHSNPTSTMKLLMGGFRGLGKQRTRQA